MNYQVNSDYIQKVLEIIEEDKSFSGDAKAYQELVSKSFSTSEGAIQRILAGYLQSLEEAVEASNLELDLTYDTVQNIPIALASLAITQQQAGYDLERNINVTAKTFAAYLTLLAINNHNVRYDIEQFSNRNNVSKPNLWADVFSLRLNFKKNSDFLPAVMEGIMDAPVLVENGFMIDTTSIRMAYKRITEVDLEEFGLSNIILSLA